jgi:hypothetical protein
MDDSAPRHQSKLPRSQPFLPPPAPGLSPTIFGRQMTRHEKWRRRAVVLILFNVMTILGLLMAFDSESNIGQRSAGIFVGAIFVVMSIASIRTAEHDRLRAGKDWLSNRDGEYVRLDRLQRVEVDHPRLGTYEVLLHDDDDGAVRLDVRVLARNPLLRQIVLHAIDGNEHRGRKVYSMPKDRALLLKESEPHDFIPYSDTEY